MYKDKNKEKNQEKNPHPYVKPTHQLSFRSINLNLKMDHQEASGSSDNDLSPGPPFTNMV